MYRDQERVFRERLFEQKFIFKQNNKALPHVHWFAMKKSDDAWLTTQYTATLSRVQCPVSLNDDDLIPLSMEGCENLEQIRKNFHGNYLSCVVQGHLTSPSTYYQLIIDCLSPEQTEDFREYMMEHGNGIYCHYLHGIKWLDDINWLNK
jgi:hypothetical protein